MYQDSKWCEECLCEILGEPIVFDEIRVYDKPAKKSPKKATNESRHVEKEIRKPINVNWETQITPKRIVFNAPSTIVWWSDETKTVVKCHKDDMYNKEAGLAMAFMKRMYGNNGYFNEILKEWC